LKRTSALNLQVRWAGVGPALNSGAALQSELCLITRDYGSDRNKEVSEYRYVVARRGFIAQKAALIIIITPVLMHTVEPLKSGH
jgi:hypothetical protein